MLGWELGYKGSLSDKLYVTADFYINELKDFVTDLLPGVNPAYPTFSAHRWRAERSGRPGRAGRAIGWRQVGQSSGPAARFGHRSRCCRAGMPRLRREPRSRAANALATLPDGSRAIVLSYTNSGKVTERGVELGVGYQFTPELRADVSFTGFDFEVKSQQAGDQLQPNTPSKKANFAVSYAGDAGLRRQRLPAAGGRLSVGGRHLQRLRAGERVREPERGLPDQQQLPRSMAPRPTCWIRSGSSCTADR